VSVHPQGQTGFSSHANSLAGSETTSSALAGLFARLIYNPPTHQKLVQEIRAAFASKDDICHEKISQLPYTNACINEALRVHPPVPAGPLRRVPGQGSTIDGHWVPGGTTVSVGMWAASHNAANWRDPDEFIPERWIDGSYSQDVKKATQPFSLGPRACLGKKYELLSVGTEGLTFFSLAMMEMRLAIVYLLWHFDISSVDGAPLWNPAGELQHMRTFQVWDRPRLAVRATPVAR